jgi:ketosteroid isomerase-like protein
VEGDEMYSLVVRMQIRKAFAELNKGNYAAVVKQFSPDAEHVFYGRSALGGSRYTLASIKKWYKRLPVIFPDLRFDLKAITVNGWPWATTVGVEWVDHFTLKDEGRGSNQGVHMFRLKWGKVVSLHIYCDTVKLDEMLGRLVAQGVMEAGEAPIEDKKAA